MTADFDQEKWSPGPIKLHNQARLFLCHKGLKDFFAQATNDDICQTIDLTGWNFFDFSFGWTIMCHTVVAVEFKHGTGPRKKWFFFHAKTAAKKILNSSVSGWLSLHYCTWGSQLPWKWTLQEQEMTLSNYTICAVLSWEKNDFEAVSIRI